MRFALSRRQIVAAGLVSSIGALNRFMNSDSYADEGSSLLRLSVKHKFEESSTIIALCWSADSNRLAVASSYGTQVNVISMQDHSSRKIEREGGGPFLGHSIALLSNQNELLWTCPDGVGQEAALCVWDIDRAAVKMVIAGADPDRDYPYNRSSIFVVSKSERLAVSAASLGTKIVCFNVADWSTTWTSNMKTGVRSIYVSENDEYVLCGGADSKLYYLDGLSGVVRSECRVPSPSGAIQAISCIAVDEIRKSIIVGVGTRIYDGIKGPKSMSENSDAALFETHPAESMSLEAKAIQDFGVTAPVRQMEWHEPTKRLFIIDVSGALLTLNLAKGNLAPVEHGLSGKISTFAFSRNAELLAIGAGRSVGLYKIDS